MSSSCARQRALMTIHSAPQMGHIAGFFVSVESLIFWPFCWFFWMHQVICTDAAKMSDELSIFLRTWLFLSYKTKSLAVNALIMRVPDG